MLYASVDWVVLVAVAFLMVAALNVVNPKFHTVPAAPYIIPTDVANCAAHDDSGCTSTLRCSSYLTAAGKPAWRCKRVPV